MVIRQEGQHISEDGCDGHKDGRDCQKDSLPWYKDSYLVTNCYVGGGSEQLLT